jgi:hypothetical protein
MNKTVYLRDDEVSVWEKARELADDKLSPIIVAALKRFIAEKEASAKGFERIVVKFNDSLDHQLPKIKAFYGRWILDEQNPARIPDLHNDERGEAFAVAETAKGNVAVYMWREDSKDRWAYRFVVYPSFEKAAADPEVNYAIRKAVEERGIAVEELDI